MNWTEKSKEIAAILIQDAGGNINEQVVLGLLEKAAYAGMVFECDNWVKQRV